MYVSVREKFNELVSSCAVAVRKIIMKLVACYFHQNFANKCQIAETSSIPPQHVLAPTKFHSPPGQSVHPNPSVFYVARIIQIYVVCESLADDAIRINQKLLVDLLDLFRHCTRL